MGLNQLLHHKTIKKLSFFMYLLTLLFGVFFSLQMLISQVYSAPADSFRSDELLTQTYSYYSSNANIQKNRGIFLQQKTDYRAAALAFKEAIVLRPNDYFLWLQLGYCENKLNNFTNSKNAYEKARRLAPNYYEPYKYLGLLYLRAKSPFEAFNYLSGAVERRPEILLNILKLAYQTFSGDGLKIETAVQLNSIENKKIMATFFIRNNLMTEKTVTFLTGNELDEASKNEFIDQFLKLKNYELAFSIWASKKGLAFLSEKENLLINGDFEKPIDLNEKSFGWVVRKDPNIRIQLENSDRNTDKIALKIDFDGKSDSSNPIISQLVIVKTNQAYTLEFMTRNEEIVTGGLPIAVVGDADTGKTINQSTPILQNNQWQKFTVAFKTGPQTHAVSIKIQRLNCQQNPCPIFGKMWLGEFKLKKTI